MTLPDLFDAADVTLRRYERTQPYALNSVLGLAPWMPPAVEVWRHQTPPASATPILRAHWLHVRKLLEQLHAEHLARVGRA